MAAATALRPDISLMGVLSGIEMACWDIVGKAVGKPVYELLGGQVHERLRSYTYHLSRPRPRRHDDAASIATPTLAAARAAEYVAQGFTAVKFDPAGPLLGSSTRASRSSSASSSPRPSADAARGGRHARPISCSAPTASSPPPARIRLARRLEPYEPLWFEEPVPPEMPEEMAQVARADCASRSPPASG